ncbi:his operon leader peptide [Photorhabdus laumondii subsp. laumondii]|uniref:his operon leader peptide n=4 Tax=Photorhabdus TaxID=29487 RepID=A0ABX0AYS0_9GAMM|nr:his operon leader peptide [Photorhabdus caribbeanensis]MBS9426606.1 his operon leader peptide [Photorhabdus akhurstii]MBS9432888.1 his operon leader peptide [Photorhabdus hainanensis]MBS9439545.1 his operon leader peptide [Photorhabdus noenieputensis]MCA6220196.1 his operon leader peptide [Photorhabdus antumapuensis]MCC8375928.1 his operon leader peptide [Photorhabdus bodei]MCC8385756.1 his operon leader peptide [Photorhabdus laumondii]MCC8459547.1 his operon leader peptide [Photorhabdus 
MIRIQFSHYHHHHPD